MYNDKFALFLDRDGTLIKDCDYLSDPDKVELLPGVKETLKQLKQKGWLFFLFTNQSGVGRGYFTMEEVNACNARMLELLEVDENFFSRICISTGTPDDPDDYRKPSPKFILECIKDYHLNPHNCWMVGDKHSDVLAGKNAGILTISLGVQDECAEVFCKSFYDLQKYLV